LPDIKERGDKHAFSSRGFCTYAAIALAIWDIAGIGVLAFLVHYAHMSVPIINTSRCLMF